MRLPNGRIRGRLLATVLGLSLGISGSLLVFAVTGSPSNFESADGNMTLQTSGNTDWNCFVNSDGFAHNGSTPSGCHVTTGATQTSADSTSGGEITWVKGEKFDTLNPLLESKSTPPKDDFVNVAAFTETASNGDIYFYGAQIRAVNNGNASGNIEFDKQSGTATSLGSRVAGDRLIAYDFINGGTGLVFHLLTWIDSTDPCAGQGPACTNPPGGTCFVKSDPLPCWGATAVLVQSSLFDGQSNQSAIAAADNGISNTALGVNQFAEFGVNLTEALGLSATTCVAFPQQVWESRSSGSSFTSSPEDIEVQNVQIRNCGEVVVIKHTDPRGINQNFSYTSTIAGTSTQISCTHATAASFTLNDGGTLPAGSNTQDCTNVPAGSSTVTEGADPSGFTFESLSCTSSGGASVTTAGRVANITMVGGGLVTCTYVNQQNSATLATQVSNAGPVFPGVTVNDTATVTGTPTGAGTPSGTVTFSLCGPTATPTGCATGGNSAGSGSLSGSGTTANATSGDVNTSSSPLAPGVYCFRADWPGDNNYPTALSEFGGVNGTNECFTVRTIPTTTTTTPSVGSGGTTTFNSSVTDHAVVQATLSGDGTPTGTVTFFICDPTQTTGGACPTGGTQVGTPVTTQAVSPATTPPSSFADSIAITANMTGTWCFRAVYTPGGANGSNYTGSGDARPSECFLVTDTTTSSSTQTWVPNDSASVSSDHNAPLPAGSTLSLQLYVGGSCTALGTLTGPAYASPSADGTQTTLSVSSNNSTAVSAGTSVEWVATYSGGPNVSPSSHCESSSWTVTQP